MEIKNLINSFAGKIMISIILGIGFATIFKKTCIDKSCLTFHGPVINLEKFHKHGEKCYKYKLNTVKCDKLKQIIDIKNPPEELNPSYFSLGNLF